MHLSDFDYLLPEHLIAQYPPRSRRAARLLAVGGNPGDLNDLGVADVPTLLRPGDLLVLNDTRVIPARLRGRKETGGAVEILIERIVDGSSALAHLRASKSPSAGTRIMLDPEGELVVRGREGELFVIETRSALPLAELMEKCGHVPLPPYIARADEPLDSERYQTIYARNPGAVAAPTAGLHFDQALLDEIKDAGAAIATVTLHVGAGTFQSLRGDDIDAHVMHAETVEVSESTCAAVSAARARGGRVVAIGTTVTRALETAALGSTEPKPYRDDTRLFIRPGFEFRVVDALLTNFHTPRSTLLMLVCAFGGYARVMQAYRHAIEARYRFFSYGDAMWLERAEGDNSREARTVKGTP